VATLPAYRRRGFATAAAALVATAIQAGGRIPVWSCGETNQASLRVATNLGFEPVLRRVYIILASRRPGE
jgi:predicted GNAT family acetyltransferase